MAKLILKDIKVGDKLKLKTDNYIVYGIHRGDTVEVVQKSGASLYFDSASGRINISWQYLEKVEETIDEITGDIKKLQKEISKQKAKLDWMDKTGNTSYDDTEFRVWTTLKTLNSASTDEEKAKVIAELIKKS